MTLSSDDRINLNHEDLKKTALKVDDILLSIHISHEHCPNGEPYPIDNGLRLIRDYHNLYPHDQNKHPIWIAMGKKYIYFLSQTQNITFLNYIPRHDFDGFVPEVYGQPQFE